MAKASAKLTPCPCLFLKLFVYFLLLRSTIEKIGRTETDAQKHCMYACNAVAMALAQSSSLAEKIGKRRGTERRRARAIAKLARATTVHRTALHCTALHCIAVLHCTALHCTSLHCTALHCTALHCTALHCTALHRTALHCTAMHLPCAVLLLFSFQCFF